jgi:general L-amino acid transport system permease protein
MAHRWIWVIAFVGLFPIIAGTLLLGGVLGLPYVDTNLWGGLMVNVVLAFVAVAGSLPLGILLALGRRSELPVVRWFCIGFIELWRGVPLLTVLFMAMVMMPLFLPEGATIDRLIRAMIGLT